jgi:hypothetical protein
MTWYAPNIVNHPLGYLTDLKVVVDEVALDRFLPLSLPRWGEGRGGFG